MSNLEKYVKCIIQRDSIQQLASEGFQVSYREYKEIKAKAEIALNRFLESKECF